MARIVLIDDEPINNQLVARAFEPLGYKLDYAEDGSGGIYLPSENANRNLTEAL